MEFYAHLAPVYLRDEVNLYLRPGELKALTWGDVDVKAGVVHVTKAYDERTACVKPPKTRLREGRRGLRPVQTLNRHAHGVHTRQISGWARANRRPLDSRGILSTNDLTGRPRHQGLVAARTLLVATPNPLCGGHP
jgi:hypothetical protein